MAKAFIGAFAVDLLTGLIIKKGTGGDKAKQAARGQDALQVISALKQIQNDDVSTGVNALAAALQGNSHLSPDEIRAINNLVTVAGNTQAVIGSTILGQINNALVTNVLNEMERVANDFISAAPAQSAMVSAEPLPSTPLVPPTQ